MSNEITRLPNTDMTESDMQRVREYMEAGLPGIADIKDANLFRMFDMYLTGSTYSQISVALGIKKVQILYLSHQSGWYATKQDYLNEIQEKIKGRVLESKIRSQEFMLLLVQAWQKRIGLKLTRFLATSDEQNMDGIDLKEVGQLMKAIEIVNSLDENGKDPKGKNPMVGLNMGDSGVTIEKTGNNSISITPKPMSTGDILKQYADKSRQEEKNKLVTKANKDDIDSKQGVKND